MRRGAAGRGVQLSELPVASYIEAFYRSDSRRVLATLIRLVGDFDLAEEALHEAFAAAVERWPRDGLPGNPFAWLVSAGRFKAIDVLRRRARFDASVGELARQLETSVDPVTIDDEPLEDDRLRLVFTCCHPALPPDAQIALTLREVCGLTTEEIAHAYLAAPRTVAQRIVRAKAKIRDAGIPYQVPARDELPRRLDAVLHVVYLVFNEGYSASSGASLTRHDLSAEAIRLGRLLAELLPEAEAIGLLGLMLLQESRRAARRQTDGELVLLSDQDRSLWNRALIAEGVALVERALSSQPVRPLLAPGGDCRRARRSGDGRRDRLGADRRTVRRARQGRPFTGRGAESRGGRGDARWAGRRTGAHRRDPRARGSGRLSVRAFCARRTAPKAGKNGRSQGRVRAGPGTHASGD